jgi:hypothetical protein
VSYASLIQGSTFNFEHRVTPDAFAIESAKHPEALPISISPPTENCLFISPAGSRYSVGLFAVTTRRAGAVFRLRRTAQRILGMGDVVSLVEKAQQQVDEKQRKSMSEKITKRNLTSEKLPAKPQAYTKPGSISSVMKTFPWVPSMDIAEHDNDHLNQTQAIIQLMMIQERRKAPVAGTDS